MKKTITLFLAVYLCASFLTVHAMAERRFNVDLGSDAYNSANHFAWGQCTWYAWGRACEKGTCLSWTNVVTGDGFGDAWTWYENARAAGYSCGTEPRANSVAVDTNPSDHGHVMFVEAIDEDIMWVTEANIKGVEYTEGYYNLSTGAYTNTYGNVSFAGGSATWNGRPMPSAYIYLDNFNPESESTDGLSGAQIAPIVEYLCQIPASSFEKYEGNEGDSCIFNFDKQGLPGNDNEYIRNGNIGVNDEEYENGFEVWLARWNGSEEISWVKATYPLNGQYSRLTGVTGLIKSYNTTRFDTAVCFYAGDKLLKLYILTPDYCNWDINVDLTGVQELTILVKDNMAVNGGTSFALADLSLRPIQIAD